MERYQVKRSPDGVERVVVPVRGPHLLNHPMYNKSTAFTREERITFGLEGLLPDVVSTIEQQAERAYGNIVRKPEPLERYIGLAALQDRNETLFYRVISGHLEEFLPVVYTPTVGRACQEYSRIFRRARGLWITPGHAGRIHEVLANAPFEDVRLIVVTDNESILGLGDQGAGGMPIPVGKLALYTAAAGIHPSRTLPVSLDVGTDNAALLADELYVGWRRPRLRGEAYDTLVDEFVRAVARRFPGALLQWEDFRKSTAFALLERYRSTLPSFNDDIQGTAAMALAGLLAGARATGTRLEEQRTVILGGGAAGIGIARLLHAALGRAGLPLEDRLRAVAVVDLDGLLVGDAPTLEPFQRTVAWPAAVADASGLGAGRRRDLAAVVRAVRATALIGVSGATGAFTNDVVRELAAHCERPLVFALSNPTSLAEAQPADVIAWTDGRALVATGSPFGPVAHAGRLHRIGQGNNAFVFPGVGLGVLVSQAREVTDEMFLAAAAALAGEVADEDVAAGALFPPMRDLRRVTARIAEAVVRRARDAGVGRVIDDAALPAAVEDAMWTPAYPPMEPA